MRSVARCIERFAFRCARTTVAGGVLQGYRESMGETITLKERTRCEGKRREEGKARAKQRHSHTLRHVLAGSNERLFLLVDHVTESHEDF